MSDPTPEGPPPLPTESDPVAAYGMPRRPRSRVPGIASLVFGIVLAIGTVAFWGSVGVLLWGS